MRIQTKTGLAILPMVTLAILFLGAWSVLTTTKTLRKSMELVMTSELSEYMDHSLEGMYQLLEKNRLTEVDSFVKKYQEHALAEAKTIHYFQTSHLLILNESGRVIFTSRQGVKHADPLWRDVAARIVSHPAGEIKGELRTSKGKEIYVGRYFKPWRWAVIYAISADEMLASARRIRNATFGVAALCIVGGFCLIFFLFRSFLISPVSHLKDAAEAIAAQEDVEHIAIRSKDELGELARSMEEMAREIQNYRTRQANWQKHLEEEIQARTEELRKSEERFRAIFESTGDCILVWDQAYNYLYANQAAIDHVGTTREKVIGKNIRDGLGHVPDFMHLWMKRVDQVFQTGKPMSVEDAVALGETTVYSESSLSPIEDSHGKMFAVGVVYRDVTDRKELEIRLKKQKEALVRSNRELEKANRQILEQQKAIIEEERLKVLLQMAGATAHEIVHPLSVLLENIRLVERNRDDPEKMTRHMARVETAGQRIAEMVRKIQSLPHVEGRPHPGDSASIDLDLSISVLCVDADESSFKGIRDLLLDKGNIRVFHAMDLDEAFQVLDTSGVDIILMDYILPSGTALDFLKLMKSKEIDLPVAVITAKGDDMAASQIIKSGAYDYLSKARLSRDSLFRVIFNALEKHRLNKEMRLAMKKMTEMSTRDELTGLYNRRYFMEVLEREMESADRHDRKLVLCMMDLDFFKKINDTHGHPAGDEVLREVARILQHFSRKCDIPCRYGGEEFAVIITDTSMKNARFFCERFRQKLEKHVIEYLGTPLRVTVSIGLAGYSSPSGESLEHFLSQADKALYSAKEQGRNRVVSVDET